ncbi:Thioredoxin- transmembrane protein 2 [Mortierella sp. GBA35]|nr:Thioredoxin- transmembrane protein 2 [Mortierella sp. AD031]KAF9107715.1 Thioredoxin- transmembrane protein 2 [Mortierella sp. GBA35]KAG0208788.1 Thioredoxin- transmembrane protein 2 [Mortierella sp. NVP41]
MSLVRRILHPHYVANVLLAISYPTYQIITHPELLSTASIGAYSRYLLPALALLTIKVRGSQSAEELVSVIALYIKVFSLYGFWAISDVRAEFWGSSWSGAWRFVLFMLSWSVVFIALPQPPYQGPSKVIWLDSAQLDYLTTPGEKKSKSKGRADDQSTLKNRSSSAKIVELDENDESMDEDEDVQDHHHHHEHGQHCNHDHDHSQHQHPKAKSTADLDPSHYWIIAFNTTWSSPCRYFEAAHANCSLKYERVNVHFAKIDMDLFPEGDQIAERFKINLAATTLDLPTLILFKDGKALKQLPPKIATKVGGEVLGKVGWDRSAESVETAFELAKLGTGKESFV